MAGDVVGRRDRLVLIAAIAMLVLVLGGMFLRAMAIGPGHSTCGAVDELTIRETKFGTLPGAWVRVGERRVYVVLNRVSRCAVGSRIELVEHRTLLGRRYEAGLGGCSGPKGV